MAEVATTKLMENDKVVVWEMVLEPGESTGVHTHHHDYVIQVVEGSTLRATDANGENPVDLNFGSNDTYWVEVKDGLIKTGNGTVSATHDAKNVGDTRYKEYLIEIK